jgi:hypothetical protein
VRYLVTVWNPNGTVRFTDAGQMSELFISQCEQLPYLSQQHDRGMTPTPLSLTSDASQFFVCCIDASGERRATSLVFTLSYTNRMHMCWIEHSWLVTSRDERNQFNYGTSKYTKCLTILSKYLHERFGRVNRSENVWEMPIDI